MKTNEPVTDREIPFPEDTILVSKTDARGIMTYANPDFIKISGFTEEELLGRNHNLVRHPDMSPEAFADLWDTVKRGDAWTGIVKNRPKNGDYYWVKTNVTPIALPNGGVEYMSVRTPLSEQEKRDAEQLYADVRCGHAKLPSTESQMSYWTLERILLLSGIGAGAFLLALFAMVALGAGAVWLYAGLAGTLLVGLGSGQLLKQYVLAPLARGRDKLRQILQDNYFDWMQVAHKGAVGKILQAIRSTRRSQADRQLVGMVVDGVSDVLDTSHVEIKPPPGNVAGIGKGHLKGMVSLDQGMVELVNVDRILSEQEFGSVVDGSV